jgi:hypothetical protein
MRQVQAATDLAPLEVQLEVKTQNVFDLAHG